MIPQAFLTEWRSVAPWKSVAQVEQDKPDKGRDLFDLWYGITTGKANPAVIADVFRKYLEAESKTVSQKEFRENLAEKINDPSFLGDTEDLLQTGLEYDHRDAHRFIEERLVGLL